MEILKSKSLMCLLALLAVLACAQAPAASRDYALHQAVLDDDIQLVRRLLSKGAAIDVIGSRQYGYGSALHLAVREGHLDIAELLLKRGARVDVLDPDDFTPLHNAAWNGNLDMARLLLDAGADIEACTYDGDTPLSLAQNNDQSAVAGFLQARLAVTSTTETPAETTTASNAGVIDLSGRYRATITGEKGLLRSLLRRQVVDSSSELYEFKDRGSKSELTLDVAIVQEGKKITGTMLNEPEGYGKIYGNVEGDTVIFNWDAFMYGKGKWLIESDGDKLTGSFFHTSGGTQFNSGKWNLAKLETASPPASLTGTYQVALTGRTKAIDRREITEVRLVQKGNGISGTFGDSAGEEYGQIFGDVDGDTIKFDFHGTYGYGQGRWTIKPGGNEIAGTWESMSSTQRGKGDWNLARIGTGNTGTNPTDVDISKDYKGDIALALGDWQSTLQKRSGGSANIPFTLASGLKAEYKTPRGAGQLLFNAIDGQGRWKGYWIENSGESKDKCFSQKNASEFWGVVVFEFNHDFSRFEGTWDFCGKGKKYTWNGQRNSANNAGLTGADGAKISSDFENDIAPALGDWKTRIHWDRSKVSSARMTINDDLRGSYRASFVDGQLVFDSVDGNGKWQGYWVEDGGAEKPCQTKKDGSRYWGNMIVQFSEDFSSFTGTWDYCGKGETYRWNGRR